MSDYTQLTLFGEVGLSQEEVGRRKKREEEKKRKLEKKEKKQNNSPVQTDKEPPADMERVVCIYRERRVFPAGTPLADILKEISEEYWEYSGNNVKMDWEIVEKEKEDGTKEKVLIVRPVIMYARKGAVPEYCSVAEAVSDLANGLTDFFRLRVKEGLYEIRKNEIGIFSTLLETSEFNGEPEWWEGVKLFLPRINVDLLIQVIGFFKNIYERYGCYEAVAHIYWDLNRGGYYVHVPYQEAGRYRLDIDWDNERCERDVLVVEIHSHHEMDAFFSNTDDKYERATRFYAVVGRVNKFFPDVRVRYANARTHREVLPEVLFEFKYPREWVNTWRTFD